MVSEVSSSVLKAVTEVAPKFECSQTKGPSETDAAAAEVHVLAVDDSLIDRKVIEKLLKNSAYKVTTVDSGRRALEVLGIAERVGSLSVNVSSDSCSPTRELNIFDHAYEINLIITDYCMPGMTGYDLLKIVKESKSLKEIPVVLMSSENVPNRISRCLEEGAEDFLLKPVQLADVKRLRGHVRPPLVQNIYMGQPDTCLKRKSPPEGHQGQNPERRPRLSSVTVL